MPTMWANSPIQLLWAETPKYSFCCGPPNGTPDWQRAERGRRPGPRLAGAGRWNPRATASLLEESYVMKDPFIPDKDKFLILGSQCSLCNRRVCVGTECSLFYSKRFCLPCVNENLREFPLEIQQDLEKRKSHSKSHPTKKADART
ncbi:cysteine-rich DPF motif domain-containing protein 1 isoform X1 [Chelonia mydas]|uniref:cysteine-rich DPF motif domain-containing protein 1 isoform X1 n=1 Tax=Chelonia mydas TaxID=8469 RepID=UPI001CA8872B|nr:cysteine-rich DPF motif domain-containing protein 1 isoform X1 [Chelonia mydas]